MSAKEIQELFDRFHYWDARIRQLECRYFADEIDLTYDDSEEFVVSCQFLGCYRVYFEHDKAYNKLRSVKEMAVSQIPYFLQDIIVGETLENDVHFFTCRISAWPLDIEVWCKDIKIIKEQKQPAD